MLLRGGAVVILLVAGACRGEQGEGAPASATARSEAADRRDRLQQAVDEVLASRTIPGASVAVIEAGELTEVTSGLADVDAQLPVHRTTEFRIASVTKMYIATLALVLVERGELALDDPIGTQGIDLPPQLSFAEDLTLRQLLSHTSGLSQTPVRDEDRGRPLTHVEQIDRMPRPACPPGECWSYADANYVLTEVVLEAKTGESLAALVRDELTVQLDLDDTEVIDPAEVEPPPQYALVYDEADQQPVEPHRLFRQAFPLIPTFVTTASDAARFADALFSGEVLRAPTLEEMLDTATMAELPCPEGCPFEYGLGVFHFDVAGHDLVGHDGGSGAIVVHDTERDLTVSILTNGGDMHMGLFLESVLEVL